MSSSQVITAAAAQTPINLLCSKPNTVNISHFPSQLSFNKFSTTRTGFSSMVHTSSSSSSSSSDGSSSAFRFRPMAAAGTAVRSTETYYDLLEIPQTGSTTTDIKRAYKKMALRYHPDVSPAGRTEEYTTRFIQVQEAYRTLSDPRTRAMYDSDMTRGLHLDNRKGTRFDPRSEETSVWKAMWQAQVMELKRKSTARSSKGGRATWGARIRNRVSMSD